MPETIYFVYAWPTDSRYGKESWVQPFLINLHSHLEKAGFPTVWLDIDSNRYGANINDFMKSARSSGYILLFGTESLFDKFDMGISAVCSELVHILRKREEDIKNGNRRVFPILISGDHRNSFPPEFERFCTIRDWRTKSYLYNFQQLFIELWGQAPKRYQSKLTRYWTEISGDNSISDWYCSQKEAVDECRRKGVELFHQDIPDDLQLSKCINILQDISICRAFAVTRGNVATLPSLEKNFLEKLKEHYLCRSNAYLPTFRQIGKWELSCPVDTIYTNLSVTEYEKKHERKYLQIEDDQLPSYKKLFGLNRTNVSGDVFLSEKLGKNVKTRALIYGPGGIGKTTFVTMLLHKWAKGECLSKFDSVLCLHLRNLTGNFYPNVPGKVFHAADLLYREYETLGADFRMLLEDENFLNNTFLILDGWDELPPEARKGGHLFQAFENLQDKFSHILVTSRPGSVDFDAQSEFEILGFGASEIEQYVAQYFDKFNASSKIASFIRFLNQSPLMWSIARIPINLSMLCGLFIVDDELCDKSAPMQVTALYGHMLNQFYKLYLNRCGEIQDEWQSRRELSSHPEITTLVDCLEEMALEAITQSSPYLDEKVVERIVDSKEISFNKLRNLGLFNIENGQGSFLHLSFQEYFVANYIANLYREAHTRTQALKIIQQNKLNSRFGRILSMVAGIHSLSNDSFLLQAYFDDLLGPPNDLGETYELGMLAQCFEECSHPEIIKQYDEFISRVVHYLERFAYPELSAILKGNRKLICQKRIMEIMIELLEKKETHEMVLQLLCDYVRYSGFLPNPIFEQILCHQISSSHKTMALKIQILSTLALANYYKSEELIDPLIALSQDQKVDEGVRLYATYALAVIASSNHAKASNLIDLLITTVRTQRGAEGYLRQRISPLLGVIASSCVDGQRESLIKALIDLLWDNEVNSWSRAFAAQTLGVLASFGKEKNEDLINSLIAFLGDKKVDGWSRSVAATAVGEMTAAGHDRKEDLIRALTIFLNDNDVDDRAKSRTVFAFSERIALDYKQGGDPIETLVSILEDKKLNNWVRSDAASALGSIASSDPDRNKNLIESLIGVLRNKEADSLLRCSAVSALEQIASSDYERKENLVNPLILLVQDNEVDEWGRGLSAFALDRIISDGYERNIDLIEPLMEVLRNKKAEDWLRSATACILGRIASSANEQNKSLIELLIAFLEDTSVDCGARSFAASAIGQTAFHIDHERNKKLINSLIALLKEKEIDGWSRSTVASALRNIPKNQLKLALLPDRADDLKFVCSVTNQALVFDDGTYQVVR